MLPMLWVYSMMGLVILWYMEENQEKSFLAALFQCETQSDLVKALLFPEKVTQRAPKTPETKVIFPKSGICPRM